MPNKYYKTVDHDNKYGGAKNIIEQEIEHIEKWRGQKPQAGIALSGGGIRSASFGLGALQALAYGGWLKEFDYLSTVSGGGYIGSSLSYLLHVSAADTGTTSPAKPTFDVSGDNFPYQSHPMAGKCPQTSSENASIQGNLLRRLRQNAQYLTPGKGITWLSLIGVVLRNTAVSVLVHVGIIVLALLLLIGLGFIETGGAGGPVTWHINKMMLVSFAAFGFYVLTSLVSVVMTGFYDVMIKCRGEHAAYKVRREYEKLTNFLLKAGIIALLVSLLPTLYMLWQYWSCSICPGSSSAVLGVFAGVWAFMQTSRMKKPKVPTGLLVTIAAAFLLLGVVMLAFAIVNALGAETGTVWTQIAIVYSVLFFAGWLPSVNYLSLHRYYRDRLMEIFMPDRKAFERPEDRCAETLDGSRTMVGDLCGVQALRNTPPEEPSHLQQAESEGVIDRRKRKDRGPYHLINANAVLVSSDNPRFRGRGGDNFIFSPLFTGSNATGWAKTDSDPANGITLATAMAISGAAVNPNTGCGGEGITRQPVLSVLMSLLNIRLGYWLGNPRKSEQAPTASGFSVLRSTFIKPNMIYPGLWESFFGRPNLHERSRFVLLSDGGHFENLGLYELVRRRLKLIMVCDGSADPRYGFSDLANAMERVRADFGAIIDIRSADLEDLVPHRLDPYPANDEIRPAAKRGYLIAPIKYARSSDGGNSSGGEDECGVLIYLTTTFFRELTADLHGYRQSHPQFPDEPTSDQFFDEKQFESYRELGYQTAWRMMLDTSGTEVGEFSLNGVSLPRARESAPCFQSP